MEKFAVVMAGGIGSRLWPLSTRKRPKQFIEIEKGMTIIEASLRRLDGIVRPENCFVITNHEQKEIMRETLEGVLPSCNILYEPSRKNTCACITYAALMVRRKCSSGVVCFIPSDSFIGHTDKYRTTLKSAFEAAERHSKMVVIGIKPSYPATGYGYIKTDIPKNLDEGSVSDCIEFTEKPCYKKAEEYVTSGQYLWNSGILVGQIDCILENVEKHKPDLFHTLSKTIEEIGDNTERDEMIQAYNTIESISFDYGVLEKSKELLVVKGEFDWSDIGSLETLSRFFSLDPILGNVVTGEHVGVDTTNSIIYSENGLVATIGLDNIAVINTGEVVLVCPKDKIQKVGDLVAILTRDGYGKYL